MNIPYGLSHFGELRRRRCVYVDKTQYLAQLEDARRGRFFLVYLRPRRFGKSTLLSMMEHYYDRNQAAHWDALFHGLAVHRMPTPERHQYLILRLEFTGIDTDGSAEDLQRSVYFKVRDAVYNFCLRYQALVPALGQLAGDLDFTQYPAELINRLLSTVQPSGERIYILVDEYDNFTNTLITHGRDALYLSVTHEGGFLRELFKTFKGGTSTGVIARMFLTGVSPMTLDDITSGANIFKNINLEREFAALSGFTQAEVAALVDQTLADEGYRLDREALLADLRRYYNGYRFHPEAEGLVYNPEMVLYFFSELRPPDRYPREMLASNVRIDYGKLRSLLLTPEGAGRPDAVAAVQTVIEEGAIRAQVRETFPLEHAFSGEFFVSLLYYLGMLTWPAPGSSSMRLCVPNQVTRRLYFESFAYLLADLVKVQLVHQPLEAAVAAMGFEGDIGPFLRFLHERVIRNLSRRDLIKLDERSVKFIPLAYLSLVDLFAPFSELELQLGYSDLVLPLNRRTHPDGRYAFLIEFKYVKVEGRGATSKGTPTARGGGSKSSKKPPTRAEQRTRRVEAALAEADAQLARYQADPRLQALVAPADLKTVSVVFVGTEAIYYREPGGPTQRVAETRRRPG